MKKLFISQPMRGKTDEEILKERKALMADVYMKTHEEIEVIKSFFESAPTDATPLWYLGESLKLLGTADLRCLPLAGRTIAGAVLSMTLL